MTNPPGYQPVMTTFGPFHREPVHWLDLLTPEQQYALIVESRRNTARALIARSGMPDLPEKP